MNFTQLEVDVMKVELDKRKIANLNKAAIRAMKSTIGEVQRDVVNAQVMPFDTGAMQNTSTFTTTEVNGDQIESRLIQMRPRRGDCTNTRNTIFKRETIRTRKANGWSRGSAENGKTSC